ncbi:MAG: shikimate kinase [Defluviitaleaceae bacterium]|nr:shikimate kinase [Defluviitaleaceae bacterium]
MKPNIALIGPMGAGKTSVGRLLSVALNMGFFDVDKEIQVARGMSITEIFQKLGETYFRRLEHEVCLQIPQMQGFVISAGGGVILNPQNIPLIKSTCVIIFLSATATTLHARLADDITRPLLVDGDRLETIKNLLNQREPLYIQATDFTIKTDKKTPKQCFEEIIDIMSRHGCL